MALVGMVWPPLVVKVVAETVATKEGSSASTPEAVTVTAPSFCESDFVPEGTEPRLTVEGTVTARAWAADGRASRRSMIVAPAAPARRAMVM
jgi:hypothetical protein